MRVRVVGVIALLALVVASCGGGALEAAGPSEGIQVHGEWTIDVYNEDGSLDRHEEFSNALLPTGASELVWMLSGAHTSAGLWQVVLYNDPLASTNDACGTVSVPEPCVIGEAQGLHADFAHDQGLVSLDGSFTADIDGYLTLVKTQLSVCTPDCDYVDFTETNAPPDPEGNFQTVDAGQTVQVQVEISFTSG